MSMSTNSIPAIFKALPSGFAWCCGSTNERGIRCKGILATGAQCGDEICPVVPIGFRLSKGVWHGGTKRQASRFTSEGQAGREYIASKKANQTEDNFSSVDQWFSEPVDPVEEMKAWARRKSQSEGESVLQFPAIIKCPGCRKNGIILNAEENIIDPSHDPFN